MSSLRVSYEGDEEVARSFLGKAQQELFRLEQRMAAYNRDQGTFNHALSDDAYCYGYVLPNGIRAIHIVASPSPESINEYVVSGSIPDFVSGITDGALIKNSPLPGAGEEMRSIWPTASSAAIHKSEFPDGANKKHPSSRLAVYPREGFDELRAQGSSTAVHSQLTVLHASMYSGKMRKLVQCLMGFGRRQKRSIYKKPRQVVLNGVATSTRQTTTAWDRESASSGLRIAYDYRFPRTHGLVSAANGSLWLCEISMARGVCMMPLPLVPDTTDISFRKLLIKAEDSDGLTVLDSFGGFPSGEPFPSGASFDAWVRAGRVVVAAGKDALRDVYACSPYSQSLGWAFNERGSEAHVTGWRFFDGDDIQKGLHYAVNLSVSPRVVVDLKRPNIASVRDAFYPLRGFDKYRDVFDAAMWKIARLSDGQFKEVTDNLSKMTLELAFELLDRIVLEPVASCSASVAEISRGNIYWGSRIQPQIKFPEYTLKYVLSHDMRPARPVPSDSVPRCDTTMHVFFVGNNLKWCKFFYDKKSHATQITGDSDWDVMWNPVGRFEQVETIGPIAIPGMFYTNEIDDRESLGIAETINRHVRRDLGWCSISDNVGASPGYSAYYDFTNTSGPLDPDFGDGGASGYHGRLLAKFKAFSYEHWRITRSSLTLRSAIIVPFYNRCSYYYALLRGHVGGINHYFYRHGSMASPYVGHWYDKDSDGHRWLEPETQRFTDNGDPWPSFWSVADDGDWVPHGADVSAVVYNNYKNTTKQVLGVEPGDITLTVQLCAGNEHGITLTHEERRVGVGVSLWEPLWFVPSPDEFGFTQYIQQFESCFGSGDTLVYQEDVNTASQKVLGAPRLAWMQSSDTLPMVNFVGVIDG